MDAALLSWLLHGQVQGIGGGHSLFGCSTATLRPEAPLHSIARFSLLATLVATVGFSVARVCWLRGRMFEAVAAFRACELFLSTVVLVVIFLAILSSVIPDGNCDALLAVSRLDAAVLMMIFLSHAFDLGMYAGGLALLDRDTLLIHHPLTLVGIAAILMRGVGGGAIVRLLLDSTTYWISLCEEVLTARMGWVAYRSMVLPGNVSLSSVFHHAYAVCWTIFRMVYV
jgi:hypothetical protein